MVLRVHSTETRKGLHGPRTSKPVHFGRVQFWLLGQLGTPPGQGTMVEGSAVAPIVKSRNVPSGARLAPTP